MQPKSDQLILRDAPYTEDEQRGLLKLPFEDPELQEKEAKALKFLRNIYIRLQKALYENRHTKSKKQPNPLHALSAYRASRAGGLDIPEWVLQYFDSFAAAALSINPDTLARRSTTSKRSGELLDKEIAKTTGLKLQGQQNAFKRFAETDRWIKGVIEYHRQLEDARLKLSGRKVPASMRDDIRATVAATLNVSPETLEHRYEELRPFLRKLPPR